MQEAGSPPFWIGTLVAPLRLASPDGSDLPQIVIQDNQRE